MKARATRELPHRRGACPRLAVPMPTGDGLLARLSCSGATVGLDTMRALCGAARRHGNGIIEITARGSIQVRGLSTASAAPFADAVAALGIDAGDSIPILVDPLAGLAGTSAIDARGLADAVRERLTDASFAAALGAKVSIALDGGHALHLDALRADIRLRADGARWQIGVGGDAATATPIGSVADAQAAEAVVRLIGTIARHGSQARARDLIRARGAEAFRAAVADLLVGLSPIPARPGSEPIGVHVLPDARVALGIGLAFGHTDADTLDALIEAARRGGASGLRTAPARALIILGVPTDAPRTLAADAERLGFITRSDDPRRSVVACAGAPVCAAAEIASRRLAPLIGTAAAPMLDGSLTVHLSGCPKGCARPAPAALTIVGRNGGCDLVIDGSAGSHAAARLASETLPAGFGHLAAEVTRARGPQESCADALARLGAERVAAILGGRHG
jgi:precorrin-3B synthase